MREESEYCEPKREKRRKMHRLKLLLGRAGNQVDEYEEKAAR